MNILMMGNSSGSAMWRLEHPAKYLDELDGFSVKVINRLPEQWELDWGNVYVTQGQVEMHMLAEIMRQQAENGKKWVVETDDYISLNDENPMKREHEKVNAEEILAVSMEECDMVTTTTEYLAKKLKKFNENVVVLPNMMDMDYWDLPLQENDTGKVRIGWGGSITHLKDIELVAKAMAEVLEERDNVEFIMVGDPRLEDYFPDSSGVSALMGCPYNNWSQKLHSMRYDIGIAPLVDNEFNRCKSNIKPLEYGICGVPSIASPTEPYLRFNGLVGMAETKEDWKKQLLNWIDNPHERKEEGQKMRNYVKEFYDVKKHISLWVDAFSSLM